VHQKDSGWFLDKGDSQIIGPTHGIHQHIGRVHDWKQSEWVACRCRLALAGGIPLLAVNRTGFQPCIVDAPKLACAHFASSQRGLGT
jgi:hypothetical protein